MSHVKNQHIVPRFILKNFSNQNQTHIWSFDKNAVDKRWKSKKNRAIKNTPTDIYIYDYIPGSSKKSIEYQLGKLETKTEPVITKLLKSRKIKNLSVLDKDILSEFIAFQILRTQKSYLNIKRFLNEFYSPIENLFNIKERPNSKYFWLDILKDADKYKDSLLNKTWILAESNEQFYTSDNPIVLQNTTNYREERGNLGLNSIGIEIYFPLSCSLLLCLFCQTTVSKKASNLICNEEIIENLNYLQYKHANRFIFSKDENFDMIEKIIKNAM
ncbi:DUF4238 domain-containing protein [Algibacter lectus]|uniref:Uncharacterized protein DUF4238 n=1 Tax=Algibacter lectus TaxID=221126 RepID=A0A4R8MFW8_9FLAO|nr:DUF4238 domain-containing protein [Algibacter lectus]MWW24759.1 DUF4238 domain-containing protein [Algibacter lectus]TDY64830.1 uncharacterized protein DUF4238 [Algibacter lectus]